MSKLDRRDFLKLASASGLSIPAWSLMPSAHAANLYTGKVLVDIFAFGGLDQSSWTDPRETDKTINDYAGLKSAVVAGQLRAAPMGNNAAFFNRYYSKMLVINGINTETNSHMDGARCHATGRLDLGYPHLDELHAYKYGQGLPMAWINSPPLNDSGNVTFSKTAGLVVPTDLPPATLFRDILDPNRASATQDHMKSGDFQKGLATRAQRIRAMQSAGTMVPRLNGIANQFLGADESRSLLGTVASQLPATFDAPQFVPAQLGLIAAKAGITSSIQISVGYFDSHSAHTTLYARELPKLTDFVDYVWQKAAALGIANRIFMRIFSEFGRTVFSTSGGKEHWGPGGTMVLMEAAPSWGNRVVGATGPRHEPRKINVATGAVDANGLSITPRHIHTALRKYLGIQTTDPRFNLRVPANEEIDLFNPNFKTGYPYH